MLNDYLYAIGKYLPASERSDILKEIECGIYDYLQAEFGKKEYSNKEIESAIMNMGNPKKVAYAYTGKERHLIAPIYLDIYFLVTKVALFGISIAFVVIGVLSFIESQSLLGVLLNILGNIWQAGLMMVAIVTIIFAAISKYAIKENKFTEEDEDWSIKDLEKAPQHVNIIKTSDIVIESIFIVLFLTFINSSSFAFRLEYNEFLIALNTEVFSRFILWFNLALFFNLALNVFLLIKRQWSIATRILSILSDFIGLAVFGVLAFHPNILDFSKATKLPSDVLEAVKLGTSIGFKIGFFVVLIVSSIEIFKHIKSILNKNKSS